MLKCLLLFTLFIYCSSFNNNLIFFPDELKKYNQETNHVEQMKVPKLKKVFPIVWFNALMGVALDAKLDNIKTPNFLCYKNYPWFQI
jgi:hypothetical protein